MFNFKHLKIEKINHKVAALIFLILLSLTFLFYKGYIFGERNHPHFIPSIYKIANPQFLNNDWYINALVPYHYLFKTFYAFLLPFCSLPILFFISYCVTIVIYVTGFKKLSDYIFNSKIPFYFLFPILMTWQVSGIEADLLIHSNTYESSFLANALAIHAIRYFLQNKTKYSFLLAGLITFVHISLGVNLFITFFVAYFLLNRGMFAVAIKSVIFPAFLYLMVSSIPIFVVLSQNNTFDNSSVGNIFIEFVHFRAPHHFILSECRSTIIKFIFITTIGVLSIANKNKTKNDKNVIFFTLTIFAGIFLQYLFTEIIPLDFIAKFHYLRMSIFISLFSLMYLANYLYQSLNENMRSILFSISVGIIFCMSTLVGLTLFLFHYFYNKIEIIKINSKAIFIIFCIFSISLIFINNEQIMFYLGKFNINLNSISIMLCAIILGIILNFNQKMKISTQYIPLILLVCVTIYFQIYNRPLYNININLRITSQSKKLFNWIKENSDINDTFISPPYISGFHLYAERRELVNYKSTPYSTNDILEWKRRMEDVLGLDDLYSLPENGWKCLPEIRKKYNEIKEKYIIRIAKKYKIGYIIFEKQKKLTFDRIYKNERFVIYRIPK